MAGPTYTLLPGDIDGATLKSKVGVEGGGWRSVEGGVWRDVKGKKTKHGSYCARPRVQSSSCGFSFEHWRHCRAGEPVGASSR